MNGERGQSVNCSQQEVIVEKKCHREVVHWVQERGEKTKSADLSCIIKTCKLTSKLDYIICLENKQKEKQKDKCLSSLI